MIPAPSLAPAGPIAIALDFQTCMCAARKVAYCRDYRFDARLQLRYARKALAGMNQRPLRATAPATVRALRVRVTSTNQNDAFFSPAIPEQRRKMHRSKNCTWKI